MSSYISEEKELTNAEKGKEAEDRLESLFRSISKDVEIERNARVVYNEEGSYREVDVLITIPDYVGLGIKEQYCCGAKNTKKPSPVGVISEIEGIRDSIRAAKAIAYSVNGFTKSALREAERLGVICLEDKDGVISQVSNNFFTPYAWVPISGIFIDPEPHASLSLGWKDVFRTKLAKGDEKDILDLAWMIHHAWKNGAGALLRTGSGAKWAEFENHLSSNLAIPITFELNGSSRYTGKVVFSNTWQVWKYNKEISYQGIGYSMGSSNFFIRDLSEAFKNKASSSAITVEGREENWILLTEKEVLAQKDDIVRAQHFILNSWEDSESFRQFMSKLFESKGNFCGK